VRVLPPDLIPKFMEPIRSLLRIINIGSTFAPIESERSHPRIEFPE